MHVVNSVCSQGNSYNLTIVVDAVEPPASEQKNPYQEKIAHKQISIVIRAISF